MRFKSIVSAVAVIAVLAAGFLAYSNWKYSGRLAEQRALVQSYAAEAKQANADAARAEISAKESNAAAAKQTEVASAHAAKAREAEAKLAAIRALVPAGPTTLDTLAAHIAAARESTTVALEAAVSWRQAYEAQLQATAKLQQAVDTLGPALDAAVAASSKLQSASTDLAAATGGSFWKRLVPHASLNVTAGVNPQGKPDVVAGVGLGWDL